MKKVFSILILAFALAACNENARTIEARTDTVLKKVENGVELLADSAKEKFKDLRNHLDSSLDDKRKRDGVRN